jgi:hypothetical protein
MRRAEKHFGSADVLTFGSFIERSLIEAASNCQQWTIRGKIRNSIT